MKILVVDDDPIHLKQMEKILKISGHEITTAISGEKGWTILKKNDFDLVLTDLKMPGMSGIDLIKRAAKFKIKSNFIVLTGYGSIKSAVDAMKSGAFDYVIKPVEVDRLVSAVNRAVSFRELKRENFALKQHILNDTLERPDAFTDIITNNKKMLSIFQYIESIAQTSQPVLIRGETGVGKELVARTLHTLSGLKGSFVAINVAG